MHLQDANNAQNFMFWFIVAFLVMLLAFIILLRLGLIVAETVSGQQRRMLVSYMQMNTLLASIGIEWPREMYVLFDIQSAISTVGDHILKIDCVLSNTYPEQLVLYLQAGYALAPFIAAGPLPFDAILSLSVTSKGIN